MNHDEKDIKCKPINYVVFATFLLAISSYFTLPLGEGSREYYWHLTLGNWIRFGGVFPVEDIWTEAGKGKAYYASNWLFSFLLSLVHSHFGDRGAICLEIFSVSFFVSVLAVSLGYMARSYFVGLLLMLPILAGTLTDLGLAPEIFGWALWVAGFALLQSFISSEEVGYSTLAAIALLSLVFVNTHASYYIALLCWMLVILLVNGVGRKQKVLFVTVTLMACCLTPYLGKQVPSTIVAFFSDLWFKMLFQQNPSNIFHYPFAVLLVLVILLGMLFHYKPHVLRRGEVFVILLFICSAFVSRSYVAYATMTVGLFIATIWGRAEGNGMGNLGLAMNVLSSKVSKLSALGLVWIFCCVAVVNIARLWRYPHNAFHVPVAATSFLLDKRNDVDFPLLHNSLDGSYLIYRFADTKGVPLHLAYFDFRTSGLNRKVAAKEIAYNAVGYGRSDLLEYSRAKTVLCRANDQFYKTLINDRDWKLVFINGEGIVEGEIVGKDKSDDSIRAAWAVFKKVT
ncbi:MAG: hypothetical protein IT291_03895 [Deltaproteobacteria bacterium]|nr:hypothetical protein [Deltaproteobacteria bacterium]